MTVYVTQDFLTRDKQTGSLVSRFDLSVGSWLGDKVRAEFGEVVFLLEPNCKPDNPHAFEMLQHGLKDYDNAIDHLILIGNPVLMALTAVAAGDMGERLNILQWGTGYYRQIVVDIS